MTVGKVCRRRFLTVLAAAAAAPLGARASGGSGASWRGVALGAHASLRIVGMPRGEAERLLDAARAEIARMEALFSIYLPESALSRLNRDGVLPAPPPEFLELLTLCAAAHAATNGAFDPTVQPVMRLLVDRKGRPGRHELDRARALIGWDRVRFDPGEIAFARPGMAMTLNGIAQGYATDRVAALLKRGGVARALVSVGEISALGGPPGRPWRVGLAERGDMPPEAWMEIEDGAIATSAPRGTTFDEAGQVGHLVDPASDAVGGAASGPLCRFLTVTGPSAAVADGLSTGLAARPADGRAFPSAPLPGYRAEMRALDG